MKKLSKVVALLLVAAMVLSMTACGNAGKKKQNIEVAVTYTGDQLDVFKGLVAKFTEKTGIEVTIDEYGDDYEATMKSRMASNELPDVFQTHGWSILRYKEYLMKLNDQPWYSDLDESALGVIADDDGSIYVLMISELINATLVNLDVCAAAGVDPYTIHTWDDLYAACETIKAAGYTPIGSNAGSGIFANIAGGFVSYGGGVDDSAAMLDGTWDWASYKTTLMDYIVKTVDNGFWAEDVLTRSNDDMTDKFANGQAAFMLGNDPGFLISALTLNPDANFAFMPTFKSTDDGKEFVGIGEGDTFGIWKDTKKADAAKEFLNFMAEAENAKTMALATGKVTCTKSAMAIDDSYGSKVFAEMKEKCADCDILYENLWDRKYMPSGMWGIFGNACKEVFGDTSEANQEAQLQYLIDNYNDCYAAAQAK